MAFNENDFKTDLATNPELVKIVFELIKDSEPVKGYASTIAQQYFNENKGKEHGVVFGMLDKALEDVGFKKPDGMKSTEYAAKIAKESLEAKKEIEILKAQNSGKNVDEKVKEIEDKYRKQISDSENSYKAKLTEYEQLLNNERTQNKVNSRMAKLSESFAKLNINPAIPKALIDDLVKYKFQELANNAEDDGGEVVWKFDGKPVKNSNHLNANTDEVIKTLFKDYIKENAAGGGSNPTAGMSSMNGDVLILSNNNFKTQAEFAEQYKKDLAAQGKPSTGEDARKIFIATTKYYNVHALRES